MYKRQLYDNHGFSQLLFLQVTLSQALTRSSSHSGSKLWREPYLLQYWHCLGLGPSLTLISITDVESGHYQVYHVTCRVAGNRKNIYQQSLKYYDVHIDFRNALMRTHIGKTYNWNVFQKCPPSLTFFFMYSLQPRMHSTFTPCTYALLVQCRYTPCETVHIYSMYRVHIPPV